MYLSRLQVRGFRASANQPMDVSLPGRFAVLLGANSAGKTTFTEGTCLAYPKIFPYRARPSKERAVACNPTTAM
jgi:putative ATP-dependent endonuclease of the OLD family